MNAPLPKSELIKLEHPFYSRPAVELAPDLIGKIVVRTLHGQVLRARIVETEAYVGAHDLASHASKGPTERTKIMYGPAGRAYVYLIYGMHEMFNIIAAGLDDPQAVLIRAAEPLDGWSVNLSGPGKLARGLEITRVLNGIDLTSGDLYLMSNSADRPTVAATPRIGIDYAQDWKDRLLRFVDVDSRALSNRKGVPASSKSESRA